jgi:hypothetical protein
MVFMQKPNNHGTWKEVAVFEELEAGTALESFLTSHGFEARAYDDKIFRYFLFLRPPRITYRVQVRSQAFEEATALIGASQPAGLTKAIHCPACGSLHVNYPQMTRRFVLPTVLLHLGILFRLVEHQCYCEQCHHLWDLPGEKRSARKVREARPFPF